MYDWIIEADIYRFRKSLTDDPKAPRRDQLLSKLHEAEDQLARLRRVGVERVLSTLHPVSSHVRG